MKERPILFNAEMIKAILSGRKTQTRRIMKNQPAGDFQDCPVQVRRDDDQFQWFSTQYGESTWFSNPLGKPGDQLWVREAFRMAKSLDTHSPREVAALSMSAGYKNPWAPIQFEADSARAGKWTGFDTPPVVTDAGKLRPSLHMPRWASRIDLLITGVRVERLNSLTNTDARAEGYPAEREIDGGSTDPWLWFRDLWDGIYPDNTFKVNPWVWVIKFQRVETPVKSGAE
jgi:hypothetical protein